MEYLILDIARILRTSGLPVSMQEVTDCVNAFRFAGTGGLDKYSFYHLVNATMIKTEWGAAYIRWLVELFFEPDTEIAEDELNILSHKATKATGEGLGRAGQGVPVDLLLDAVLKHNVNLIYALFKTLNPEINLQCEDREKALADFQRKSGWSEVSGKVVSGYHQGKISLADYEAALEILREWNDLLKYEIESQLIKNMSREHIVEILKKLNPRTANFRDADNSQIAQMTREIEKLGRKLAIRKGRRRKVACKGRDDISRSIKRAFRTGGIPFELVKTRHKPSKPDLWLLCDVSNSVILFSYFMLMFVYSTQKRYANIRSFIFVDMLMEVTDYFQGQEWSKALGRIRTLKGCNVTGYSHYGNVLHQFVEENLAHLDKKTTVIILGDAKNNWNKNDGSEDLAKIKEHAAALYWLNPMDRSIWDRDDCIMAKYQEQCTGVYQCSNIKQLENFIKDIW